DCCFPHRIECVGALEAAIAQEPGDARARYYLGNFWYSRQRHAEAIAAWEASRDLDPGFATIHRNLGLAYMNVRRDSLAALRMYERAFALDPSDARVLYEFDQLRARHGDAPADRRTALARHPTLVDQRDDLTIEYVTLLNLAGEHEHALDILLGRRFHPWEG